MPVQNGIVPNLHIQYRDWVKFGFYKVGPCTTLQAKKKRPCFRKFGRPAHPHQRASSPSAPSNIELKSKKYSNPTKIINLRALIGLETMEWARPGNALPNPCTFNREARYGLAVQPHMLGLSLYSSQRVTCARHIQPR